MPSFRNGKVEIAYLDEGEGEPIVLIHGFASTKEVNWLLTSWFATLTKAGRRTIALDNRGHGASTKLYDPADYHSAIMLNGAKIGKNSLVGAGSVVTEGKSFPDNSLIVGAPARVIRTLDEKAAEMIRAGADIYVRRWKHYAQRLMRIG